jgi:hypothetical protein
MHLTLLDAPHTLQGLAAVFADALAGRKLLYLVQGLSRALLSASSSADTHGRSSSRPRAAECTWPPTTPSTSPGVAELASCYSATAWANTEGAKVASFFSREISYSTKRSTEIQILRLSAGSCPASPGGGSAAALRPGRQCHAVDRSRYSTRSAGRAMVRRTSASPQFTRASSGHVRFKKKSSGHVCRAVAREAEAFDILFHFSTMEARQGH